MSKHAEQPWTQYEIQGIKGQKLDMRGSTVNLRGAKCESDTLTSYEFHLFVCELCQGVTVPHLNSPQELVTMTKE